MGVLPWALATAPPRVRWSAHGATAMRYTHVTLGIGDPTPCERPRSSP